MLSDKTMILLFNRLKNSKFIDVFDQKKQKEIKETEIISQDNNYNFYQTILSDFEYEEQLYNYYTSWWNRRTTIHLLFLISTLSFTNAITKKLNPKIKNKTYRSYDNFYIRLRIKTIKKLLHAINWALKTIDSLEENQEIFEKTIKTT